MTRELIDEILAEVTVPGSDPAFFQEIYSALSRRRREVQAKDGDNIRRSCSEDYDDLTRLLDIVPLQDSCSVRNVLRTRRMGNLLIDDKGELNQTLLPVLITRLTESLYFLGPDRQHDSLRQEHILKTLISLENNKTLLQLLKKLNKPYGNPLAEEIIRSTLQLPPNTNITDAHIRRAALSAWFCYLRQNVGSCFATAPAIVVHDVQFEQFLSDLHSLLSVSQLKRTFGGIEHSVPLSTSWGAGDLRRLFPVRRALDTPEWWPIWLSPGLTSAFMAAGLIQEENTSQMKEVLQQVMSAWPGKEEVIVTSAEDIMQNALLLRLGISKHDVEEYENKPIGLVHSGLLMQMPSSATKIVGRTNACAQFLERFEAAKNAFKAMTDNALLKSWEFTLASFAETKAEFTRWNLYSSLGMGPEEKGGIGFCIYSILQKKLQECNQKVQEIQTEYEQVYAQVKFIEGRVRIAGSEKEIQWLRAEYQSRINEFYTLEEIRDKANRKANQIAKLFDVLIEYYYSAFPKYFQEVYDADMHEVGVGPYDDSPAGFRLLYKHGRTHTSLWTKIRNHNEFVQALSSFFTSTEYDLQAKEGLEELHQEIGQIVTAIVIHVKTDEFINTAFHRMAIAHNTTPIRDPLQHLDSIEKKPWAYTSGGTMNGLVSNYYALPDKPTEVSRWVESPTELCVFLVDVVKQMPAKEQNEFLENPRKPLLMHSPTHAFLFLPGLNPFCQAWQADVYTYTWVRDYFVRPATHFVDHVELDTSMMDFLLQKLSEQLPVDFRAYFIHLLGQSGTMGPTDFRLYLEDRLTKDRNLRIHDRPVISEDQVDSALYTHIPLFYGSDLENRLKQLFSVMPNPKPEGLTECIELISSRVRGNEVLSAESLQKLALAALSIAVGWTSAPIDYHLHVNAAAQSLGYAMPAPIIFADTNWVKDHFAFVVNPGTGRFELWRVDSIGRTGAPMSIWEEWLNGRRKDRTWGVYTRPHEYTRS